MNKLTKYAIVVLLLAIGGLTTALYLRAQEIYAGYLECHDNRAAVSQVERLISEIGDPLVSKPRKYAKR